MGKSRDSQQNSTVACPRESLTIGTNESGSSDRRNAIYGHLFDNPNFLPAVTEIDEIASELNNIVAIIIGNSDFLEECPDDPKRTRYLAGHILNAAERAAGLVQKLPLHNQQHGLSPHLHPNQVGALYEDFFPLQRNM